MLRNPYFWAALLSPVLTGALLWRYGLTTAFMLYTGFALLLLVLSAIDCDRLILPDSLTLPGAVLALLLAGQVVPVGEAYTGAFVGGGGFWLLASCFPKNLGLGDAKLMLLLGALCGVRGLPVVVALGSSCGLAFALTTGRKRVPFGPFLCLGGYLHMLGVQA